jgi:hypothetical protein
MDTQLTENEINNALSKLSAILNSQLPSKIPQIQVSIPNDIKSGSRIANVAIDYEVSGVNGLNYIHIDDFKIASSQTSGVNSTRNFELSASFKANTQCLIIGKESYKFLFHIGSTILRGRSQIFDLKLNATGTLSATKVGAQVKINTLNIATLNLTFTRVQTQIDPSPSFLRLFILPITNALKTRVDSNTIPHRIIPEATNKLKIILQNQINANLKID